MEALAGPKGSFPVEDKENMTQDIQGSLQRLKLQTPYQSMTTLPLDTTQFNSKLIGDPLVASTPIGLSERPVNVMYGGRELGVKQKNINFGDKPGLYERPKQVVYGGPGLSERPVNVMYGGQGLSERPVNVMYGGQGLSERPVNVMYGGQGLSERPVNVMYGGQGLSERPVNVVYGGQGLSERPVNVMYGGPGISERPDNVVYGGPGLTSTPCVRADPNVRPRPGNNRLCESLGSTIYGQGLTGNMNNPGNPLSRLQYGSLTRQVTPAVGLFPASVGGQTTSSSGQFTSGSGSVLRPDEAYPSKLNKPGGEEKDEEKQKSVNPQLLQCQGQLKLSAYMNFGLLTVHVVQGRQLSTKWKTTCDAFVKLSLIPEDGKKPRCKTDVIDDSNNPLFDEKFSFELNEEDHNKRLLVSVWNRNQNASLNEFLGCMSFGIRHLTNPRKEVGGWYYLLTEEIGRKKHLQVSHKQKPHLKVRSQGHSNIPAINKDVWGMESLKLTLLRGKNGFGFSVVESCPVRVGRVDGASPAETAGLLPGDIIIRVNGQNVSRSIATSVAKLVKHSSNSLVLELQRTKPVTFEQIENTIIDSCATAPYDLDLQTQGDDLDEKTMPQIYTIIDDSKENEISVDEDNMISMNSDMVTMATSTPLPLLARGHRTVQTSECRKQEAIHRLLSIELDFIDLMHAGMQRYSRPLRHCILSHSQHAALFQNIEKLTTISEYHIKQMHDNAPSSMLSDDTDSSATSDNHNFINSVGLIYQSKVHMLCQAYDLYAKGISNAKHVLSGLRQSEDFVKFVKDPPLEGRQPSISAFIYRPVQHIRELYHVLQEVFTNTPTYSQDYDSLRQVFEGLKECVNNITNYSCARVESVSSLESRESKASFTGSMKSGSSRSSGGSSSASKPTIKVPTNSMQSSRSVDTEVMKIQDRLIFPPNVPIFQLCQDERHMIFSGDIFKWEGQQWVKLYVVLFTDMMLLTKPEADGYLRVIQEPLMLRDVSGLDAQRKHGTEFVLHCSPKILTSSRSSKAKFSFRAPSTEQKYAWKSLIEQRVYSIRGSLQYFSSTSDVSSSSASAIII